MATRSAGARRTDQNGGHVACTSPDGTQRRGRDHGRLVWIGLAARTSRERAVARRAADRSPTPPQDPGPRAARACDDGRPSENDARRFVERRKRFGRLDIVICNAGFGYGTLAEDTPPDAAR